MNVQRVPQRESPKPDITSGQNISLGGICLTVASPYPPGAMLSLEIQLMGWEKYTLPAVEAENGRDSTKMRALGVVVWCRPGPGGRKHEAGIRFVDIDEKDYRALMNYLKHLEPLAENESDGNGH